MSERKWTVRVNAADEETHYGQGVSVWRSHDRRDMWCVSVPVAGALRYIPMSEYSLEDAKAYAVALWRLA